MALEYFVFLYCNALLVVSKILNILHTRRSSFLLLFWILIGSKGVGICRKVYVLYFKVEDNMKWGNVEFHL